MIKWIVFAVISAGWIATCYVFGSLVGGTAAGVPAGRAMDDCARRLVAAAAQRGETLDMADARFSPECRAAHMRVLNEVSAPATRKGLLWGIVPVVLIGGLMVMRARNYG